MGVTPKLTSCATPQPNHVENPIYIVTMRGCALWVMANVPNCFKAILLPYAIKYVYMTCGLEVIDIGNKTCMRYKHLCAKLPKFISYMHPFSKAGTLKDCLVNSPKSCDCGIACMFVERRLCHHC